MSEQLGRHELRGELGRGGMGVVYRAYDPTLDREVAIKSLRLEGIDEAARAALEERLSREARAAAKLQHPHIVAVYDFFRVEDRAYIVMEYVRGLMLDAVIAAGSRNLATVMKVLRQAAAALDAAHAAGIVQRDIKPGNILIGEDGNIKIRDFGIGRMTTPGATETMPQGLGSTVGTLGYMAPEQIREEKAGGRVDQFSLGIVAYQLFSGVMPFEADTWIALSYKIIHEPPTKLEGEVEGVTAAMERAIEKAVAKQPGERLQSCAEFVEALGKASAGEKAGRKTLLLAPAAVLVRVGMAWMFWKPAEVKQEPVVVAPAPTIEYAPEKKAPVVVAKPEWAEFAEIAAGRFLMARIRIVMNRSRGAWCS